MIETLVLGLVLTFSFEAAQHRGQVKLGEVPVPGAVVTAFQNDKKFVAVTDPQGTYSFPDLTDGTWTIQIEMLGFAPLKKDVTVSAEAPTSTWELTILPIAEIGAATSVAAKPIEAVGNGPARPAPTPPRPAAQRPVAPTPSPADEPNDLSQSAADGLLINGSVNNGAASPFAQAAAFGNARRTRALYTGGIGVFVDNSAFDARAFSVTGQNTPKPSYNHAIGAFSFGGPIRLPGMIVRNSNFFFNYQRTQNRNANTVSALVPTMAQRDGDLSAFGSPIIDPSTGNTFPGNRIPPNRISPQARALLNYFPLPNFETGNRFNYQVPLIGATHQDSIQARANKSINPRNSINGEFGLQRTASDTATVLGFLDKAHMWGITGSANFVHRLGVRGSLTLRYQFNRNTTRLTPNFANRINVSADAGITGNNQDPVNWGPPSLNFSSGITGMSDAQAASNRNQTHGFGFSGLWNRGRHSLQYGSNFRRQQYNVLSQQDARGTFTFTGATTGYDFADFLLGVPTTSAIAFGNADKYFRQSLYDAFFSDDFRMRSGLTLNLGVRWEYEAPLTEKYGRIVNLDIGEGFVSAAPVIGGRLNPDRSGIQPRVSMAWRPFPASSLVVRAGYGIYRNTSVYQSIVSQMAQQAPLSKSLSVRNSPTNPLTLANGFQAVGITTPNTFAVDPNFRVGSAHTWNLTVQRDLPASLMMIATYLGTRGTHLMQQFLPNTYPTGAVNPCPSCPSGFAFLTSNGSSRRESGQIQLRRRLRAGFTANIQYTLAKATDDAGFSAANPLIAQNWLDLKAEHAPSSFDQRHQVSAQAQYTTGMGAAGGALMSGWRGTLFKEWTILSQLTVGSGLPLTPIYLAALPGIGITGSVRPNYVGGPELNRSSYTAPALGQWGNASRNSIIGPKQFGLNSSLARTVRIGDRLNADIRVDASNVLNHVTYPTWNTLVTSAQFGLPNRANDMRKIQSSLRIRF